MPREIDLSTLRAFVTVARTGGMTVAGRHLNLTQAAVSQQIKRLEEQFQTQLFDRGQRRISLTQSGERLLGPAERILAENDAIWGMMTSPEIEGTVRLGVPHDIVSPFKAPILRGFSKAWPRVDVSLTIGTTRELRRRLDDGELDLTLTTESMTDSGGERLMMDRLVWVGAPNGEAHARNPLPVTMGDENCAFREAAVEALSEAGRDWRFLCAVSHMTAMCATIEADLAVAPLLSQTVPEGLEILMPSSGLPALPVYFVNLYRQKAGVSPIAEALASHISKSFAARYPQAA